MSMMIETVRGGEDGVFNPYIAIISNEKPKIAVSIKNLISIVLAQRYYNN